MSDKMKPCPFCGGEDITPNRRGCGYGAYLCDSTMGHECNDCDTWSANWDNRVKELR